MIENPYIKIIEKLEKERKTEYERLEILPIIYLNQLSWYAHLNNLLGTRKLHYSPSIYYKIPFYLEDELRKFDVSSTYKKDIKKNLKKIINEISITRKNINKLDDIINFNKKCMEYYNNILEISGENLKIISLIIDVSTDMKILEDVVLKLRDFIRKTEQKVN